MTVMQKIEKTDKFTDSLFDLSGGNTSRVALGVLVGSGIVVDGTADILGSTLLIA